MSDIEADTLTGTLAGGGSKPGPGGGVLGGGRGGGGRGAGRGGLGTVAEAPLADLYDFNTYRGAGGGGGGGGGGGLGLAIHEEKERLMDMIESSRVSVITGYTGCGKTTQVPQFILDHYAHHRPGERVNIVVTQPRRIAAVSVARRVSGYYWMDLII